MASSLRLKKSNCKNCYKCIRECPVKAIRFSGGQAHIIDEECILCGHCFVVCPQNAKEIVDDTEKVRVMLQGDDPVVVSLAPSFIANYRGVGIESMTEALKRLGFYAVEETAMGATVVKNEYERILREEERDVIISSSCHSVNLLIQKHFPHLMKYLADVVSPMQAHCMDIKRRIPNAKTVFIGPCVSKKDEAEHYGSIVDAVLTFEDLSQWLMIEAIDLEQDAPVQEHTNARLFPTSGGILKTMEQNISGYSYAVVDGVNNCIAALKDIESGKVQKCFIEMSACPGSCVGGPVMEKYQGSNTISDYLAVIRYAGTKDFQVEQPERVQLQKRFLEIKSRYEVPSEIEINRVLRQMHKFNRAQELNCGSCGYNTCREKAIAVCQGKAEISMCISYLKDKAESFSDIILRNTPNGLIVLNEELEVQQINEAARRILNIRLASDVLGASVVRILDPIIFFDVLDSGKDIHNYRTFLTDYNRYVEQTVVHDKESRLLIMIIRDVTGEEVQRKKKEKISRQTMEVADKVVEKQMRIVQEIASLLGETTAETKIALTKLKESIADE